MRTVKTKRPRAVMPFHQGTAVGDTGERAKRRAQCRQREWRSQWEQGAQARLWEDGSAFRRALGRRARLQSYRAPLNPRERNGPPGSESYFHYLVLFSGVTTSVGPLSHKRCYKLHVQPRWYKDECINITY